jgi:hypothetical protein
MNERAGDGHRALPFQRAAGRPAAERGLSISENGSPEQAGVRRRRSGVPRADPAFSPNGKMIAAAGGDGSVTVGKPSTFDAPLILHFFADGRHLYYLV